MNTERHKELVHLLTDFDLRGTSFYEAKQSLLKRGFSEAEISHALFEANFDGKKNQPHEPSEHARLMAENPELAQKVADTLIAADYEKEWSKDKARMLGHIGTRLNPIGGNMRMSVFAESNAYFFGGFGFLFFLVVLMLVSSAKGWSIAWLEWAQFFFSIILLVSLIVYIVRRQIHIHRIRRQQKQSDDKNK